MKYLLLAAVLMASVSAKADPTKFGDPLQYLPQAGAAIADYLPIHTVFFIESMDRPDDGGTGTCNPVGWKFLFYAGKKSNREVMATVTVYEEAYSSFVDGRRVITCKLATHFEIKDEIPLGASVLPKDLAGFVSVDAAAAAIQKEYQSEHTDSISLTSVSISKALHPRAQVLYSFTGKGCGDKTIYASFNAESGVVLNKINCSEAQ